MQAVPTGASCPTGEHVCFKLSAKMLAYSWPRWEAQHPWPCECAAPWPRGGWWQEGPSFTYGNPARGKTPGQTEEPRGQGWGLRERQESPEAPASSALTSCDPELSLLPLGYNFPSEDPPGTPRPVQLEWTLFLGKTPCKQQVTCDDFSPCVSGVPVPPPLPHIRVSGTGGP